MRPILFEPFGFKVHSYGVMLVISFLAGIWLAQKRAPKFGLTKEDVLDAAFWAVFLGILGARALYIIQEWGTYSKDWHQIVKLQFDGLTSFGAIIGGVLGFIIWAKRSKKSLINMLDVATAPFLLAHPIGRIGCLLNGCCYGGVCDLPWGVPVEGHPGLYHPAQVYDGLMNLVALGVLLWIEKKGKLRSGQSVGIFLMLHGTTRIIYELWRVGTTSTTMGNLPFTDAQAAAGAMVLLGVGIFVWRAKVGMPRTVTS